MGSTSSPKSSKHTGLIAFGATLLVGGLLVLSSGSGGKDGRLLATSDRPSGPQKQIAVTGDVVVLTAEADTVLVAMSQKDLDRFRQLAFAKDDVGLLRLVREGKLISVKSGTVCRIIDGGFLTHEIRIMEGEFKDQSGFVPVEQVKK